MFTIVSLTLVGYADELDHLMQFYNDQFIPLKVKNPY